MHKRQGRGPAAGTVKHSAARHWGCSSACAAAAESGLPCCTQPKASHGLSLRAGRAGGPPGVLAQQDVRDQRPAGLPDTLRGGGPDQAPQRARHGQRDRPHHLPAPWRARLRQVQDQGGACLASSAAPMHASLLKLVASFAGPWSVHGRPRSTPRPRCLTVRTHAGLRAACAGQGEGHAPHQRGRPDQPDRGHAAAP